MSGSLYLGAVHFDGDPGLGHVQVAHVREPVRP
jgi:hypothetical protein